MDGSDLRDSLAARFADPPDVPDDLPGADILARLAGHASCRAFRPDPVPDAWLDVLCATALSAPSKSDLQGRDIVVLRDPGRRARLAALVSGQAWVADAPMLAVFCGNNRRQRLLHEWQGVPFANDHLDAFFNAACDAAIALGAFVAAARAMGLGCCPISAVRNEAAAVSDLLDLPDHVFPFAGLAIGFPAAASPISMRLPLSATVHADRYREDGLREAIAGYDAARRAVQPYAVQRDVARHGATPDYGWSDDKVRQYALPERDGFGRYVRSIGFRLD
ncbi:nitroreductase family protein [Jannaschia sp. LMIT008]|uniref:nitroreductase family protein n=1 Tax=Jannaschia maritima TaxID=3032585 RepID=UPI0028111EA6|nr:nitroreductase family protein [Jannaschia sp. LMIT008]